MRVAAPVDLGARGDDAGRGPMDAGAIAALDPLRLDDALARLPATNRASDVRALAATTRAHLPPPACVRAMSVEQAAASMRDLGMLLASVRRHGPEPTEVVPELAPVLVALGARTGMVPRDTVYHYAPWNPRGARERVFTGHDGERALVECVRVAVPHLESAIERLVALDEVDPRAGAFADACAAAERDVGTMVDVIDLARSRVDVVFFARGLRPYFEPVRVLGREYLGPAAAHVPLYLVDDLVWAADCGDAELRRMQDEAAEHSPARWRRAYVARAAAPSLAARVLRAHAEGADMRASARALVALLDVLVRFRGRHHGVARRAYDPLVRLHDVGSGGYATPALTRVLRLTVAARRRLTPCCGGPPRRR
jgi:hypothetical protein